MRIVHDKKLPSIHHTALYIIAIFVLLLHLLVFLPCVSPAQDEYTFDLSEIEKRPGHFGGYLEARPVLFGLDRDASLYRLKFYNREHENRLEEYNFKLQLEGGYEWKKSGVHVRINSDLYKTYLGWSEETALYEGYLSFKPAYSLSIEIGKRQLKWGKGYAWNPVAFLDRPKNPDDPEAGLEGFIVAKADYIKSFAGGPLQSLAFTPVLLPVYDHINDDFGAHNYLDFALKTYFLIYDTDVDILLMSDGSRTDRYGIDFSRNIKTNFEIHGEYACITDQSVRFIDGNGSIFERGGDAKAILLGIRYLTVSDITCICEYYHNGAGFSKKEMRDYYGFIQKGYDQYLLSGHETYLKKALQITEGGYGRMNPMKEYLYLRISQKEPFDILYFTPAVTLIYNLIDNSRSLSPEFLYTPLTNLELRLKAAFISGKRLSEYGEKQNDYRIEFSAKHYF